MKRGAVRERLIRESTIPPGIWPRRLHDMDCLDLGLRGMRMAQKDKSRILKAAALQYELASAVIADSDLIARLAVTGYY